jgi:hypothetical protein
MGNLLIFGSKVVVSRRVLLAFSFLGRFGSSEQGELVFSDAMTMIGTKKNDVYWISDFL